MFSVSVHSGKPKVLGHIFWLRGHVFPVTQGRCCLSCILEMFSLEQPKRDGAGCMVLHLTCPHTTKSWDWFFFFLCCILESENSVSTAIQTGEWLWQHLCDSLRMCACSERVGRELFFLPNLHRDCWHPVPKRQTVLPS